MPTPNMGDLEQVTKSMREAADNVKLIGEKALAEAARAGTLNTETKSKVDEALSKFGDVLKVQTEVTNRLVEIEQAQSAMKAGQESRVAVKSVGQQFVESESFLKGLEKFKASGNRGVISSQVKAVTSLTTSAGPGVAPDFRGDIMSLARRKFTIRDLMLPGSTSGNAITYVRELSSTNNAAPVSETVRKPESTLTLETMTQAVITLAHFFKASVQILDDIPQLMSYIDGRARYGLMYAEELQLLKGSGTGLNLNGIYTQASTFAAPIVTPAPTKIDQIRLAILQVFLTDFAPATGIVLNPADWAAIELTKDTQGRYIFGDPQGVAAPRLWGLPVVETQAMTQDTALVGAFRPYSQIFDRQDMNVVVATENEDDFVRNMITIRAEERLASAVYRPTAFVKITDLAAT